MSKEACGCQIEIAFRRGALRRQFVGHAADDQLAVGNVEQMMQSCFSSIVPLVTSVTVAVVVTALNDPRVLWLYLFAVPVAGITVGGRLADRRPTAALVGGTVALALASVWCWVVRSPW